MDYLRSVWALAAKDLRTELRTLERVSAMGAFAVLVGVLFNFAIDPTLVRVQDIAAGLIWITIIFSGLLGMGRTFQLEEEDGALTGLLQSPIPLDALFLAKVLANTVLLTFVVVLVFFVFGMFFHLEMLGNGLALVGVVILGLIGFVGVTTLFSAMASRTTMGESLLPVLVFPLVVPVVIYGVSGTARLFAGRPVAEVSGNLRMLGAFALVAVLVGAWLFRFVIEE
jgi:heme exporter protein B